MQLKSSVPNIVLEAGLPTRFRYWSGRSGARYLFTRTDPAGLGHFDEAVVIIARSGRIVWAGNPPAGNAALAELHALLQRDGTEIYVHLLARTADQRELIIDDMRAVFHVEQTGPEGSAQILEFPVAA
jgi:hypothetical protein